MSCNPRDIYVVHTFTMSLSWTNFLSNFTILLSFLYFPDKFSYQVNLIKCFFLFSQIELRNNIFFYVVRSENKEW